MTNLVGPIQHKRGTTRQWASSNVPLRDGELGIDSTLRRMKVGDGATLWAGLPWSSMGTDEVARLEAAAAALEGATAPTDAVMAVVQANPDSAFTKAQKSVIAVAAGPAISAALASDPSVVSNAAQLAQSASGLVLKEDAAGWRWALLYEGNREVAFGQRDDGSFYPPTIGALSFADGAVSEMSDDQGWRFAFAYASTGEVVFGQRNDGRFYPDTLGGAKLGVTIHGDSLTAGWAPYVGALSASIGRTVTARGNGGQTSYWVAARQGGQPLRISISGNAIPASDAVAVTVAYPPLVASSGITQTTTVPSGSYEGSINGVSGVLTIASDGSAVFARTTPGRVTPVASGTDFVTGNVARQSYPILWAGRNNFKEVNDAAQIVRDLRAMLAWTAQRTNALVLSIPPWVGEENGTSVRTRLDATNAAIRDAFPGYYVDTAALLRSEAIIQAVGLTPTSTDVANIGAGLTPESFRTDAGHLNGKGYEALNLIIKDIYSSRGLTA